MKVYGNSSNDGFGLLSVVMGGVFALGGAGLAFVGGATLWGALALVAVVGVVMMRGVQKWEPLRDVPAIDASTPVPEMTKFPMAAASDAHPQPAKAAWAPAADQLAHLPAHVERPKSGVETNTPVV